MFIFFSTPLINVRHANSTFVNNLPIYRDTVYNRVAGVSIEK